MKSLSRLVFLAGAVAIGLFLFRAAPRDVTLVYGLDAPGARSLEVAIEQGGEIVRHAEIRIPDAAPPAVSHRVRLIDGEYVVHVVLITGGGTRRLERPITVSESGTIVIPLS